MKKTIIFVIILIFVFNGCKTFFKNSETGNFRIENYSDKVIEFVWIAPEGEFYPTVQSINVKKDEIYEVQGLDAGYYDIAIDFKGEYNSFNSKKDKSLLLSVEEGLTTNWIVNESGKIILE